MTPSIRRTPILRLVAGGTFAVVNLCASAGATAQPTVYRCGNTYSPIPCADGKAVETRESAASVGNVDAARTDAARRGALADRMQRDRLRAEAAPRPGAASLSPAVSAASAPLKPKKGTKGKMRVVDGDDFTATAPKKPTTAPRPARKATTADPR